MTSVAPAITPLHTGHGKQQIIITPAKRKIYELDAEAIAFYRRNPCIAAEDLLGVKLIDAQKYILQSTWNASHSAWACSRNLGKSFLGAILMILKAILYENQGIYIVSSKGSQSKETFSKIEEIVLRIGKTSASIRSLKDIVEKETVKNANNKTGFRKPPEGHEVAFYNGSTITTLNGNPDNNRSRRASLVFFDEAAFCSDELIAACVAFAMQNTDFATSTDDDYNPELEKLKVPTQLVFASSQDDMTKEFYKRYKEYAKKMLVGDRRYFSCDMICSVAITPYMNGEPYIPLLTKDKVDSEMKSNEEKALREYYNRPSTDGGISQIIKWHTIRNNETFVLPVLKWRPNGRYIIAFDPARTCDNSILSVMELYEDEKLGLCGRIVNSLNLIDLATTQKYKLDSTRQLEIIRDTMLSYNGAYNDYENIDQLLIDAGSGGGGISAYADPLMNDWVDSYGTSHRGVIDGHNPLYSTYKSRYPSAIEIVNAVQPAKYKRKMVEEFIDLMTLGAITFPEEYSGKETVSLVNKDEDQQEVVVDYELSKEEKLALVNIDLMKREITSIHRFENQDGTSVQYSLAKEKKDKMHDDRFYTAILLAHRLYELRRQRVVRQKPEAIDALDYIKKLRRLNRKPRAY